MNLLKHLKYIGLCAGIAALALNASNAWAEGDDADANVDITVVEPSVTAAGIAANFGSWAVVNKASSTATLTISTAGVISQAAAGAFPNARFIAIDATTGVDALKFTLRDGAFNQQLSFQIGQAAVAAGEIDNVNVTLTETLGTGTATFVVNNWNCVVDPDGAYGAVGGGGGILEVFTPDPAHATNGLATVTLGTADPGPAAVANGGANIACGMDITTDGTDNPYIDGTYRGVARILVDYI